MILEHPLILFVALLGFVLLALGSMALLIWRESIQPAAKARLNADGEAIWRRLDRRSSESVPKWLLRFIVQGAVYLAKWKWRNRFGKLDIFCCLIYAGILTPGLFDLLIMLFSWLTATPMPMADGVALVSE